MKLVKIDPPGSWCNYQAIFEMLKKRGGKTFVDVGCGAGELSNKLCERGFKGIGIDYSEDAIDICKKTMESHITKGNYNLKYGNAMAVEKDENKIQQDLAVSLMVMEHIEDDRQFVRNVSSLVKPGGHVLIAVPGRMDRWGPEDETVGHYRRYENYELKKTLEEGGLKNVEVWSVAVPTANWLFNIGNWLIKNSKEIDKKDNMSIEDQTKSSGIRDIPFKTVFPSWFKIILNKYTLSPLFFIQRFFYKTNLGLTMVASGEVVEGK